MLLCTLKYFSSDTLHMNFQLSSKSLSSDNSSKLQVLEASPRCRKKKKKKRKEKSCSYSPFCDNRSSHFYVSLFNLRLQQMMENF
jgi:hypothetical protein